MSSGGSQSSGSNQEPDTYIPLSPPVPYPPPDVTQGGVGEGPCGTERICGCIGDQLNYMGKALFNIKDVLEKKLGGICDKIDDCIDKIIEAIDKKFRGIAKTCEQCKQEAKAGLSGTLEYAITCAGACVEQAEKQCQSLADDGKTCDTCKCKPCVCTGLECVSVDETACPEETKKWVGFCNRETGLWLVQEEGKGTVPPGFTQIALTDTEEEAIAAASAYCQSYRHPAESPIFVPQPRSDYPAPGCNIYDYQSASAFASMFGSADGTAALQAGAAITQRLRQIGFEGLNVGSVADVLRGLVTLWSGNDYNIANAYIPQIANLIGCGSGGFTEPAKILAAVGMMEKVSGTNFSEFTMPYRYAMHMRCRQLQLNPDQAMAAFLANGCDFNALDTYWGIAGYCSEAMQANLQATRSKPVPLQLAQLRRRKCISPSEYALKMRELGYLNQSETEDLFKLSENIPTLSDIIHLMIRDADDETIQFWPESDRLFDQKYRQQLRKWADWQGVPEQFAKYAWRAHWTIPSPGQLFEFWHRLRYDPAFGGKDSLLKQIKSALIQQDILPFWHEHYLAVSFRPMGRIDIRRSFNIGTLPEDELIPSYIQLGYSDEVAEKLAKFSIRLRRDTAASHKAIKLWVKFAIDATAAEQRMLDDGLPQDIVDRAFADAEIQFMTCSYATAFVRGDMSKEAFVNALTEHGISVAGADNIASQLALKIINHPAINDYAVGEIDKDDARQRMIDDGMSEAVVDRLLRKAEHTINQSFLVTCQKGIKRRFIMGELDAQQATNELTSRGTTLARANNMVDWWGCERTSTGKAISASKLCDWLARGAITPADFRARLIRIGYNETEAALMLEDCLISINVRRLTQAKREAKEQAIEAARVARLIARQNALLEREAARLASANKARATTKARRDKQLLKAGEHVAGKCSCGLYESLQLVRTERARIETHYGLEIDDTLKIITIASEQWDGGAQDTFSTVVTALAETAVSANLAPAVEAV